ncbi:hypothetical protein D1010_02545 [Schleiferilactobacillus harbinensis]|uniref:Uncharacterized protein n=1 Tax=Schleiferilactobacillus harbinensis TaxID=304207 RepID=A0A5P8M2B5_9LACO|nr:hypothetical protein D1010_02545 [Schleiferilactobacillus harbinensis]
MLLGDFETAQQAQNAVMAFQPPQPQLAELWHGRQRTTFLPPLKKGVGFHGPRSAGHSARIVS